MKTLLVAISLAGLTACYDPNAQSSRIVREVEAAGAGNVASMLYPEIADWMGRHGDRDLIARVDAQCAGLRHQADAGWSYRTAEGRVCMAALLLDTPQQFTVDHTQFGAVPGVSH